MHMDLVPSFSNTSLALPERLGETQLIPIGPGMFSGVHIFIEPALLEQFVATIERWFDDSEEVIFVDSGVSRKQGLGFVTLEWEECQINPLFLKILDTTEFITDYSIYVRTEDV